MSAMKPSMVHEDTSTTQSEASAFCSEVAMVMVRRASAAWNSFICMLRKRAWRQKKQTQIRAGKFWKSFVLY